MPQAASFRTAVIDVTILQRLITAIQLAGCDTHDDAEQKAASSVQRCQRSHASGRRFPIGARALTQIADEAEVSLRNHVDAEAAWADQVRSDVEQARVAVRRSTPGIRRA